ncbi:MAG: hypothetical protein M3134_03070 [Actinomycetota bacterium]|nr:hypothetical protein [Actinomycetota bacterium]
MYKFSGSPAQHADGPRKREDGMARRNLELNKETLRDLTDVDLAEVAGGA